MILPVGIGPQEGGYQIERSLRFNSADSAYLSRTPASAGNRKTWTWSGWVKLGDLTKAGTSNWNCIFGAYTDNNNRLFAYTRDNTNGNVFQIFNQSSGSTNLQLVSTQVFRDTSAWYHFVIAVDTTQATSSNRCKVYVNGSQITAWSTATYPSQNADLYYNSNNTHLIGASYYSGLSLYHDGYLTEVNFIDGSALDPSSFGEYNTDTGVWQPKAYTGSYGTNGFYLDFADNSSTTALGYDAAGSNDWTPNNFSVTAGAGNDSLVDTPTNYGTDTGAGGEVRGNYATANPLKKPSTSTITNGNLAVAHDSSGGEQPANFAVSSGKWYWEATPNSVYAAYGIILTSVTPSASSFANGYHYYGGNGQFYTGTSNAVYGSTFTNGDVIGVALDLDTNQITFYKNGTSQGAKSISAGEYYPDFAAAATNTTNINFGQRPFAYTAPSGFKALCTQNLPEPTVVDGGEYFNTVLYDGTGAAQTITGVGFQPDLVWLKARNIVADNYVFDAVRGAQKRLEPNTTDAESTNSAGLNSFVSDGFTLGIGITYNGAGNTFVGWNWKANGAGVSNTAGTITSTVSANTTSGFSIVTYSGSGSNGTVGHGLGNAPQMVIVKQRNGSTYSWTVYHASLTSGYVLALESTSAQFSRSTSFNSTAPTSTVFSLGTDLGTNSSSGTYVAYCFAPVSGFSSAFSYTGNGSTDGSFVYLGFRPRMIMIKRTDTTSNWVIWDTARDTYNASGLGLYPNLSAAEDDYRSSNPHDVLSNGFKPRANYANVNASGGTYVGFAWAENPFKYSLAR